MTPTDLVLIGSYDPCLVLLSVLIAVAASYTALDLGGRMTAARGRARLYWMAGGSTTMGLGIWSMHYIGMLAFNLPAPMRYDWPTVLLSLLAGILSSGLALLVVSRQTMGYFRAGAASVFMGAGIAGLHYTAMAAMRVPAMCHYVPWLVALSVLLAMGFSLAALWLTCLFREGTPRTSLKLAGAMLMGGAVSAMHYTGMAAARFTPSALVPDLSHAVTISSLGAAGIATVSVMVLCIALVTSMTDRLQKQRSLLDELFAQNPLAMALLDLDNRIVRINREFSRVFGYLPQEAIGHTLRELVVPKEFQNEVQKHWEIVSQGRRADTEGVRQRKDGSRLDVAMVFVPFLVAGGEVAAYAIYHDITEHRRAQEELRRSEAYLAAGQRLSHTGSWALNMSSGELFWSQETFHIFGFDPATTKASFVETFLQRIHPEDRPRIEQGIKEPPAESKDYTADYRIVLPDGSLKYVHDVVYTVTNEAGQIVERYGLVMDVTERKRVEEEQRRSFEQLRALTGKLQNAREEERTRVAREIHDELGQALTAIKMELASLFREHPVAKDRQSILELADETIRSVRRIATELRPGLLDDLGLVAAMEWAAEEFQSRTKMKVDVRLPDVEIAIDTERSTALFRIFQETLTNVVRHANATQVNVRLAEENGFLLLEVHDNGRGIGPDQPSTGTSLGILGMRERALLLGGEFIIGGSPGKGTTVRVRIPKANRGQAEVGK